MDGDSQYQDHFEDHIPILSTQLAQAAASQTETVRNTAWLSGTLPGWQEKCLAGAGLISSILFLHVSANHRPTPHVLF